MTEQWLYKPNADNSARFVLGTVGDNPLVCFGVNPSTAAPSDLDPTLKTVSKVATLNGYDSWIMLNVYPQRATDPNGIHSVLDAALRAENERHIGELIDGRSLTLWAAWGSLITKRPFLRENLQGILDLPALSASTWVSRGTVSKAGHPHHPLYAKDTEPFAPYSVASYRRSGDGSDG
jgi:hypothetical protein